MTLPDAPRRPVPPAGPRWLNRRAWRDHRTAMDQWVPQWEAWKMAAHRSQMEQWSEQEGTCTKCGLPIRLHPPERTYAAELWMCNEARKATNVDRP